MNAGIRVITTLVLAVSSTCVGVRADESQVAQLTSRHRAGQTLLTWREVDPPITSDAISVGELRKVRKESGNAKKVRYRIYRSDRPITSLDDLRPIAEVRPLSCWNANYYGAHAKPEDPALRYVVDDGRPPVAPGTGIHAHNPEKPGRAYYAVTVSIDGTENTAVGPPNALSKPTEETVGPGAPVLQRIEKPERFQYVSGPTLHYFVRWESPPRCNVSGKPFDYVVAVPPELAKPAPVGIHLHCWGGSLNGGYGWWYNAEKGHLLLASNQIPYDWWTGYHELYGKGPREQELWRRGVVRPYSQRRMLAFLDWMATRWDIDPARTHVAGSSMGGSGSPMLAIRFPDRIAWSVSWVGIHNPAQSPHFKGSYEGVYGKEAWGVKFEDGTSVWDHYNDAHYLRAHRRAEIGLITFSNGKNDGAIGWPQAVDFYRALQETHRPHVFVWGQSGHGQRARMPVSLGERVLPIDVRIDQTLPAFAGCTLDDDPGKGDPSDGDSEGQVNLYLAWDTEDIVDRADRWEMTVRLIEKAPRDECQVDLTPRRCQQFKLTPGQKIHWSNTAGRGSKPLESGEATADRWGLVTLGGIRVSKAGNRIRIEK